MTKKPESQQYQGLASSNKAIMPTSPCKVGTHQISLQFSALLFSNNHSNIIYLYKIHIPNQKRMEFWENLKYKY
jgi:hypothetical protein